MFYYDNLFLTSVSDIIVKREKKDIQSSWEPNVFSF